MTLQLIQNSRLPILHNNQQTETLKTPILELPNFLKQFKNPKTQFRKMPKSRLLDPKSEDNVSSAEESKNVAAEEEEHGGRRNQGKKLSDYELQRLKRIEENKSRMEALGLRKMANSFMGSVEKTQKRIRDEKGKRKMDDEDEEYNPTHEDEEMSSSEEDDHDDEEFSPSKRKGAKKNIPTPKKKETVKKPVFDSDFVDDDDALMQAIALSLQDSSGDVKSNPPAQKRNENPKTPDDSGKNKRKKQMTSRVQMTEDELLIHFFQFDETGRGGFTVRDVQRMATAHDFTWSEKEMADMISCFDNDGDGKISLEDFRKIVDQCGMLKVP